MIIPASIAGASIAINGAISGASLTLSGSVDVPTIGLPFDYRTINTAGGTGDGTFSTLAGQYWAGQADNGNIGHQDGAGNVAKFYFLNGATIGADGFAYFTEFGYEPANQDHPPNIAAGHTIRRVNRITGEVSTLAGSPGQAGYADGHGSAARFKALVALFPTTTGLLATEYGDSNLQGNARVRHITYSGRVTTVAFTGAYSNVDGPAASASMVGVNGVTMDSQGNIYVCGYATTAPNAGVVRKIANDGPRTVTTIATGLALPANMAMFNDSELWVIGFTSGTLYKIDLANGNTVTTVTTELGTNANGIAKGNGCLYYVLAGPSAPGDKVMRVSIPDGTVSDVAGVSGEHDDPVNNFHSLSCVAFDGTHVYAGESYGCRVTKMLPP